jgi:quercetin dioxygenase-like cupin family protein
MNTAATHSSTFTAHLPTLADYSKAGVSRQNLVKTEHQSFALVSLTAGTYLPEHTAPRPVSVTVIAGRGTLTLEGQDVNLEPGVFVYMPAHTPHALQAIENLSLLHS